MTTEDDFQAAIDAEPANGLLRQVFADWLDDRGDDRAAGYRALGALGMSPRHFRPTSDPRDDHWMYQLLRQWAWNAAYTFDDRRPEMGAWFRAFEPRVYGSHHRTRRGTDDAAARAFGGLTPGQQAAALSPVLAGAGSHGGG